MMKRKFKNLVTLYYNCYEGWIVGDKPDAFDMKNGRDRFIRKGSVFELDTDEHILILVNNKLSLWSKTLDIYIDAGWFTEINYKQS